MTTIELVGRITTEGQLEIDLPPDLPAGEVRVLIETAPFGSEHQEQFKQRIQKVMGEHRWLIDELAKQ